MVGSCVVKSMNMSQNKSHWVRSKLTSCVTGGTVGQVGERGVADVVARLAAGRLIVNHSEVVHAQA